MNEQYSAMRSNVSMLGKLLGETIREALGEPILDKVESIRRLSKSSRAGNGADRQELLNALQNLSYDELLPVARAFNQFLNLANTAEQYHSISPHGEMVNCPVVLGELFTRLQEKDISRDAIENAIQHLSIELVLTAHPTEITRRTLIHKLVAVNHCLQQLDHEDLPQHERNRIMARLRQLVAQAWHTDEMRKQRPTPVDEAKWGFAVVENSLWQGVPLFLREFSDEVESSLGYRLPPDALPVRFTSWMGGDRDGNPNVTAEVTRHVLLLSRWKAAELFFNDIQTLISELSMTECTPELQQLAGGETVLEPYRAVLKQLRTRLLHTQRWLEANLHGEYGPQPADVLMDNEQFWQPLITCYQSLHACGMGIIADGQLLDTLRRIRCFGLQLVRIDIRQESSRHTEALAELTRHLGLGDYASWSEREKQSFLIHELNSRRPLLPVR
ncbi:MAG: phosphoenolpyruvate carboxylase, partial [Enterobacteriaceae bacterium]